jgi:hypothetical protein
VVLVALAGTAGAVTLAFTDDVKFGYKAAERSGRVLSTLYACIYE